MILFIRETVHVHQLKCCLSTSLNVCPAWVFAPPAWVFAPMVENLSFRKWT